MSPLLASLEKQLDLYRSRSIDPDLDQNMEILKVSAVLRVQKSRSRWSIRSPPSIGLLMRRLALFMWSILMLPSENTKTRPVIPKSKPCLSPRMHHVEGSGQTHVAVYHSFLQLATFQKKKRRKKKKTENEDASSEALFSDGSSYVSEVRMLR